MAINFPKLATTIAFAEESFSSIAFSVSPNSTLCYRPCGSYCSAVKIDCIVVQSGEVQRSVLKINLNGAVPTPLASEIVGIQCLRSMCTWFSTQNITSLRNRAGDSLSVWASSMKCYLHACLFESYFGTALMTLIIVSCSLFKGSRSLEYKSWGSDGKSAGLFDLQPPPPDNIGSSIRSKSTRNGLFECTCSSLRCTFSSR